jgi:hypothetical protein
MGTVGSRGFQGVKVKWELWGQDKFRMESNMGIVGSRGFQGLKVKWELWGLEDFRD